MREPTSIIAAIEFANKVKVEADNDINISWWEWCMFGLKYALGE